jgi:DNA-binding response OmpR family regulator
LRILIADDNRDEVLTLMALLREEGYEVQGAHSGEVVLRMAENAEADVYILDIGMPGMSGYDVARALRERYGHAPVIIAITAWQRTPDKLAAEIAGFDHHFGKPFHIRALLDLLLAVASRPHSH